MRDHLRFLGVSQENFCEKSGISLSTIERCVREGKVWYKPWSRSYGRMLKAIQVLYREREEKTNIALPIPSHLGEMEPMRPIDTKKMGLKVVAVSEGDLEVEIVLPEDFSCLNSEKLDSICKALAGVIGEDFQITKIGPGSIKIRLVTQADKAEKLLWAIRTGELKYAGITGAEIAGDDLGQWIASIKEGDEEAVQHLWDYCSHRLRQLPLIVVPRILRRKITNAEDIAIEVFREVCLGMKAGRFEDIKSADHLWWLLSAATRNKAVDQHRRFVASKNDGRQEFPVSSMRQSMLGDKQAPEFIAAHREQNEQLISRLPDELLQQIAASRLEGRTVSEIAENFSISTRNVERKLQLIQGHLEQEAIKELEKKLRKK